MSNTELKNIWQINYANKKIFYEPSILVIIIQNSFEIIIKN